MSSTVNELSTAQLRSILSILQISHSDAVANAMALITGETASTVNAATATATDSTVNPSVQNGAASQFQETDAAVAQPEPAHVPSSLAASVVTPRRRNERARRPASSVRRAIAEIQDHNERPIVDDDNVDTQAAVAGKRKRGNRGSERGTAESGGNRRRRRTQTLHFPGMIPTPGAQRIQETSEDPPLTILDGENQEFKGHVVRGTCLKGSGKFKHIHVNDDEDLNGQETFYEGEFNTKSGETKFEGQGKLTHARGTILEGKFENGYIEGHGTCVWPGGWRYEGDWHKDERHGCGKLVQWDVENDMELEDGEQYEGHFKKDLKHGKGKLKMRGGDIVEGIFKRGEQNGRGKYFFANGSLYEGEFKDDFRNGYGKMAYAEDGSRYEGHWRDNERNGDGTLMKKDGSVFKGSFKDDYEYTGILKHVDGKAEEYVKGKVLEETK